MRDPETGHFRKGNPGAWKPGQSGNPGGRPKGANLTAAILRKLAADPDDEGIGKATRQIADRVVEALTSGNGKGIEDMTALLKETWDRTEGKVTDKVEASVRTDSTTLELHGAMQNPPELPGGKEEEGEEG